MYARTISMLFYMFFTCVILNPQVGGFTVYFYLFIPFFDPGFTRFLTSTVRRWSGPLAVAVAVSLIGSPTVAVRVISLAICIGYLLYSKQRRIFYLHVWMLINIGFAALQFVLYYVNRDLAMALGPRALGQMIWGSYATAAYTNFFEVFYFARVSGLSREAGFFSSLLVASLVVYLATSERIDKRVVALYVFGLIISFSKSSMLLFLFAALYPFRKPLRAAHPLVVFCAFAVSITALSVFMGNHNFFGSETFGHRFGGYPFMVEAKLEDLISGISAPEILKHYRYLPYIRLIEADMMVAGVPFAGLPASVADMGLFSALLLFGVVAFTASDGFVLLLFLLISSTVSITTVTSFVPLGYLLLYWPRFQTYIAEQRLAAWHKGPRSALTRARRFSPPRTPRARAMRVVEGE
ncbi:hypothetical protein [Caballeronia grimmiae]|jgi:hypothetical protein|uniref:hypothetical protein n=1 Tax=Caballeronia grimmiae TaxID=1071679 RepID=UPI0038B9A8DA